MATFTSPGTVDIYRGKTRVWRGSPTKEMLAAVGALLESKFGTGTYEVRWPSATAYVSKITVNGAIDLP
jgi:hypothetical protein